MLLKHSCNTVLKSLCVVKGYIYASIYYIYIIYIFSVMLGIKLIVVGKRVKPNYLQYFYRVNSFTTLYINYNVYTL